MRHLALSLIAAWLVAAAGLCAPRPGPFRFCYGLDGPVALPIIRDLGLDTLYMQPSLKTAQDPKPAIALVRQARQQGLRVIVELPTLLTDSYRVSPYDGPYTKRVREVVGLLARQLKDEPGVTAWATAWPLERHLSLSDDDFREYLRARYGSLDELNARWGSAVPTWPTLTMSLARELEQDAPYKIGPAAIDLVDYQAEAYRRVMLVWLEAIRAQDPQRPVLTGRITLYRSLLSVPSGYDVVCTSMPPDVLVEHENDLEAHNPQALDIARRGGKFNVMPVFRVPNNASPAYGAGSLGDWMHHAGLHGAVGFGLEDWSLLADMYDLERNLTDARARHLLNAIREAAQVPCDLTPQATTAVIYSPYASGFDVTRQPVYGYILGYLPGEPSGLVGALRLGTRYGVVDYLSVADLKERELGDYGCVLAPACLNLPPPQAGQLAEYVRGGGALMADLGLGAYQAKSWVQLPEAVREAFGIVQLGNLKERLTDLVAAEGLEALAPWPRGARATGIFSPSGGGVGAGSASATAAERRTYPVSGWTAEALLAEGTVPLVTASVRFDADKHPIFSGVIAREDGSGLALFATHPLWEYWPLSDPLNQLLHGRLMARRANYELIQTGLLQSGPYFSGGKQGAAVFNPGRTPALAQLWAYDAGSHAYAGCASSFMAAPAQQGLRPGAGLLVAEVPARQTLAMPKTNLIVQPHAGDATVLMREHTPQGIVFDIAGAGCVANQSLRGLQLRGGQTVPIRLVLGTGLYPVTAQSRHEVTVRTRNGETSAVVTADEKGELDLSGDYAGSTVTIRPAP